MKNKYLIIAILVFLGACKIDNPNPIDIININYGAALRTVAITSSTYNYFDLSASEFIVELEEDDPQRGKLIQSVNVYVTHQRGIVASSEVLLRTIPASEFVVNEDVSKLPRTTVTVSAPEAIAAVGKALADINAGDFFTIRLELTLTDGRKFTDDNASEAIRGVGRSPFAYRVNVVCPSDLADTYAFTATNMIAGGDPAGCEEPLVGEVKFAAVAGSPGSYTISDASFGLFDCAYDDNPPGGTLRLGDACNKLSFSGEDRYTDKYTISNVVVNGADLEFDWVNTYDDGAHVKLTRTDGSSWPPLY